MRRYLTNNNRLPGLAPGIPHRETGLAEHSMSAKKTTSQLVLELLEPEAELSNSSTTDAQTILIKTLPHIARTRFRTGKD